MRCFEESCRATEFYPDPSQCDIFIFAFDEMQNISRDVTALICAIVLRYTCDERLRAFRQVTLELQEFLQLIQETLVFVIRQIYAHIAVTQNLDVTVFHPVPIAWCQVAVVLQQHVVSF